MINTSQHRIKDSGSKRAPIIFEEKKKHIQKLLKNEKVLDKLADDVIHNFLIYMTTEQRLTIFTRMWERFDLETGEEREVQITSKAGA